MRSNPRTIFLFSLEPWADMWYSKHHYAAELAKSHTVYFVGLPERWRFLDLFSIGVQVRTTPEGVRVIHMRNNLPLRPFGGRLGGLVGWLNARKLRRLMPEGEVLLWSFHPTLPLIDKLLRIPDTRAIYHVVDPYQNLPNDAAFARRVDLVVAINPWYLNYYGHFNRNCMLVPHGVRPADRMHNPDAVAGYRELWGTFAVLATGVNKYVNYRLLLRLAHSLPHLRIVVAGKWFALDPQLHALRHELFAMPNVVYAGVLHPDALKDLIHASRIGLLTYDMEPSRSKPNAAGRTPLKTLTYLAQLRPVVSTNNSYIPELEGIGHYKAEDEGHFLELVAQVLADVNAVDGTRVRAYLDAVNYARLTERILEQLDALSSAPDPTEKVRIHRDADSDQRPLVPWNCPILIVSNEEWNGPRYSKHRYALALTAKRKVYFVDPPDPWRPSHALRMRIRERTTSQGITILSYNNAIPLLGGKLGPFNDRIIARRIRKYLERNDWDAPLFWTFDPSRLADLDVLAPEISVYHCADDHAFRLRGERLLAERSDHVFCIARDLMPRFQELNGSVHHLPHGLDDEDIVPDPIRAEDRPAPPGYGLYIGNINDRHDFVLWETMFRNHPEIDWVIVGPTRVTSPIGERLIKDPDLPNVHFVGAVPYTRLAALIKEAGFGFLYMQPDHPANRISSQKVVQFLAQGKPIFCSWFSEYTDHRELVYMSDDPDEALQLFDRWLLEGDPPDALAARLAYAEQQHFRTLLERLPFRFQ